MKQKIAIIAPLILISMMIPVFRLLATAFGEDTGWYLGLVTYWIIWGGIFAWVILGKRNFLENIKPQKLNATIFLLVLFPLLMTFVFKFFTGSNYDKPNLGITALLLLTCFGNGFFEEVLWRGVYMVLFPDNLFFRIIWPSLWFGLWHYAPGSVSSDGNVVGLMVGSGMMGFYLSFVAKKTGTIWWTIIAHTLGGVIMILF